MPPERPRDTNQLAKLMVHMTTGQVPNDSLDEPPARAKGGHAVSMSAERRREFASKAAAARWVNLA